MTDTGLYIHIPFCTKKCNYCSFYSVSDSKGLVEPYFNALKKELAQYDGSDISFSTIYFGGGTPTSVDLGYIADLIKFIYKRFDIAPNAEITVECNPKTVTYEGFCKLKDTKINRLSFGLQSVYDDDLLLLGRAHTYSDFLDGYTAARKAGFRNISTDLMFGLPNQTLSRWEHTLKTVLDLGLQHISAYVLKIEEGTPFYSADLTLPCDDEIRDMYDMCVDVLGNEGLNRYEISNFAKRSRQSAHNLKYWRCHDYIGIGTAAHSCYQGRRYGNAAGIGEYIEKTNKSESCREFETVLTKAEKMSEFMFLGLRLEDGVSRCEFKAQFEKELDEIYGKTVEKLAHLGAVVSDNNSIRLSHDIFFVSNTIMLEFI